MPIAQHSLRKDLNRAGFLGLEFEEQQSGGSLPVVVRKVLPNSAAEANGLHVGDLILTVNNVAVRRPAEIQALISRFRAGDSLPIAVGRGNETIQKTLILPGKPFETSSFAEVLYESVNVNGSRLRVILTKPHSPGPFPAILLIGGLGCYSLDGLQEDGDAYGILLYGLTRKGFVTMRVEKSGEGDSEGPACSSPESDFRQAVARSIAGLKALRNYDFVDRDKVFIFAHSIGPIEGVVAAAEVPVRGFVAAETIGRNWFEYQLEIMRQQMLINGVPYDRSDQVVRREEACLHRFYVEKQTPEQILKDTPGCGSVKNFDVAYTYMQQVGDVDLAKEWKKVDVPVLVIYGTTDATTNSNESLWLVNMINSFHPGRATYLEIQGMCHDFTNAASPKECLDALRKGKHGAFNPAILTGVDEWLNRVLTGRI